VWWFTAPGVKFGILLPEVVVALIREASDPSISFSYFFGERWVREWNRMEGGKGGILELWAPDGGGSPLPVLVLVERRVPVLV